MLRMSEVNAVDHQAMQHMLTEGAVDWDGFGDQIAQETDALLGGAESVLVIDESAFAKKGEASAGVARQWNGRLGKVDNCQVGVFATLCRGEMASLIDARLYLPKAWAEDEVRCRKAAIPEDGAALPQQDRVGAGDGRNGDAVAGCASVMSAWTAATARSRPFCAGSTGLGCRFVADVHCDQTIYLAEPRSTSASSGRDAGNVRFTSRRNLPRCGSTAGRPNNRPRHGNG